MIPPWYVVLLVLACGIHLTYISVLVYRREHIIGHSLIWIILLLYALICLTFGFDNLGLFLPIAFSKSPYLVWLNATCYYLLPVAWISFCLNYVGKPEYLTKKNLGILLIVPAIMSMALFFTSTGLIQDLPLQNLLNRSQLLLGYIGFCYIYGLTILGTIILARKHRDVSKTFRHQIIFLIISSVIPLIAELITDSGFIPSFDPFCLDAAASGLICAFGVMYYDILRYSPIFRENFFEILNSGLIVLDKNLHLLDMNPVAEQILRISLSEAFGKLPSEIASFSPEFRAVLEHPDDIPQRPLSLITDDIRSYHVSALWIQRKISTEGAYLFIFTDITQNMNLEKQVLETRAELSREKERLIHARKYRQFFDSNRDAIIIISHNRIVECNPIAYAMFQECKDELIGMDPVLLSATRQGNPDDVPDKFRYYLTQAAAGGFVDFSWRFQSANEEIVAQVRLSNLEHNDQRMIEMSIRDMTDIFLQLQSDAITIQHLTDILSKDIRLWSDVSEILHSYAHQNQAGLHAIQEILNQANRNLELIQAYQDER